MKFREIGPKRVLRFVRNLGLKVTEVNKVYTVTSTKYQQNVSKI
jgi:hypothetical protein